MTRIKQLALGAVLLAVAVPAVAAGTASAAQSSAARSAAAWQDVAGTPPARRNGARPDVRPDRFRALTLDRRALARVLAAAGRERRLTISLPAPDGGLRRFAVRRSSVMEPGLAAAHPEIATYAGTGIDDRGASIRLDLTPQGFHAAIRGPGGTWYVDPYYHRDQSLYASYRGADLRANPHGAFVEHDVLGARAARSAPGRVGPAVQLRTYRLALVSDPTYATFHGADDVLAAKVTLINRVNELYEDDFAIHLSLIDGTEQLNLDTAAKMTGANGPCGAAPCYTADQADSCSGETLDRTRIVLGQLIGASNFDVGHIGMGNSGGGIAYLGVVGDDLKGGGCTGVTQPTGDLFAVDYVAHEIGHQFAGNHTFNGIDGACGGNIAGTSVEPGSGVTVMAYAGICATDDLQPHSDPYFSQRSIDEVTAYTGGAADAVDEVQVVSLRGFSGTDSFRLSYNGAQSAVITRGTNYSSAGIATAIKGIAGFPAGGTVTVVDWDDAGERRRTPASRCGSGARCEHGRVAAEHHLAGRDHRLRGRDGAGRAEPQRRHREPDRQPRAGGHRARRVHDPEAHAVQPHRLGDRRRRRHAHLPVGAERQRAPARASSPTPRPAGRCSASSAPPRSSVPRTR